MLERFKNRFKQWVFEKITCTKVTLNPDGTCSVFGDLFMFERARTYHIIMELIPPIKDLHGSFYCNNSGLFSLQYVPRIISGDFWCMDNRLSDLKGGPNRVEGNYWAPNNNISTLHGINCTVGKEFWIFGNPIKFGKSELPDIIPAETCICEREQVVLEDPVAFKDIMPI